MSQSAPRKRSGAVPFRNFKPAKRLATQYEEVTVHTQWDPGNYAAKASSHRGFATTNLSAPKDRLTQRRPPWPSRFVSTSPNKFWSI